MSRIISPSSRKPYGLARVCRIWRAARATVYRQRVPSGAEPPRRPGPVGPMPDSALLAAIRAILVASPFHGEGHRKVWAELVKVPPAQRVEYQRRADCASPACGPRNAGCCA
jgi:putative transposase